jgi:hypothetical protein
MKALRIALLAIVTMSASIVHAQTADEVVTKHIEATGGADAWRKVNSLKTEGMLTVQGNIQIPVVITQLHNKGMRAEFSVMGQNAYQIMTPTAGWNYMPFQGHTKPEPSTADQVKDAEDDLDAQGSLVDYKAKGHSVALIGKEDFEGVEAHKLQLTLKGGKVMTMLIDPKTFYVLKMSSKQNVNGQEVESSFTMANYKKLPEGIVVPMSITRPEGEMVITKVTVNGPVDEAIFKPSN